MPNGNPIGTEKFAYKLAWLKRLEDWTRAELEAEEPLVIAGDYNIIPTPLDAKYPENWVTDALYTPEARAAFRRFAALGLTDAVRAVDGGGGIYTFWDYQAGAWQKNNGIRIDHLMLSPEAADRLVSAGVDRHVRAWEKPSDHVPVWIELSEVTCPKRFAPAFYRRCMRHACRLAAALLSRGVLAGGTLCRARGVDRRADRPAASRRLRHARACGRSQRRVVDVRTARCG